MGFNYIVTKVINMKIPDMIFGSIVVFVVAYVLTCTPAINMVMDDKLKNSEISHIIHVLLTAVTIISNILLLCCLALKNSPKVQRLTKATKCMYKCVLAICGAAIISYMIALLIYLWEKKGGISFGLILCELFIVMIIAVVVKVFATIFKSNIGIGDDLEKNVNGTETAAQSGGEKQNEGPVPQAPGEDDGAVTLKATNEPRENE